MNIKTIPNLNILWASLIIEELVRNDIRDFFIAPGSRSAPLTIAVAQNKKANNYIHFDERGLGYFALGKISASKKPAVLISTSGTAVANFLPAIIETSKKKLPLIILTADRPPELLNTGAPQTIAQKGIFEKYVRWEFDMPTPDIGIKPEMVLTTINQAIFKAKNPEPGPVHINCAFREPLSPQELAFDNKHYTESLNIWAVGNLPYTKYYTEKSISNFNEDNKNDIVNMLNNKSGIIVVGKLNTVEQRRSVKQIAEKLQWPIFADLTSGMRIGVKGVECKNIIHYFDKILGSGKFDDIKIDTILHIGGRMTSKNYYEYIKRIKPINYITVLNHYLRNDPLHCVSHRIKSDVFDFISLLLPNIQAGRDEFLKILKIASNKIDVLLSKRLQEENKINEISVARIVSVNNIKNGGLFLSNSMPIRDMDFYADSKGSKVIIGSNRGASGIDGIIASSCGFSEGIDSTVTTIIGDLAFLHDMNSLSLIGAIKNKLIIIIINNGGGGIFSFLPIKNYPEVFEKYFGTPHGFSFDGIAKMFHLDYFYPTTNTAFREKYKQALKSKKSTIIEVKTNREENLQLHKTIDIDIKKVLGG